MFDADTDHWADNALQGFQRGDCPVRRIAGGENHRLIHDDPGLFMGGTKAPDPLGCVVIARPPADEGDRLAAMALAGRGGGRPPSGPLAAFGVSPDQKKYIAPEARARIW